MAIFVTKTLATDKSTRSARRKLGPKIRTCQPSTADAVAFRIPNDKVFLLVCTVDESYATNASIVFDMVGLVAKVISKTDVLVRIIDDGELKRQRVIRLLS